MAGGVCRRRRSNLQCFLSRITPSVMSYSPPKSCFQDESEPWPPVGKDTIGCFTLGDLWDNYNEWSAYGAGSPILLNNGETVVQYYVPYLSAIQIYTNKPSSVSRNSGEDSETDSWSDDSESEKPSRSWDAGSDDSAGDLDSVWPGKDRLGHLYLHYVENSSPYGRVPLMVKDSIIGDTIENDSCCCIPGKTGTKLNETSDYISLPPFGLATYKMQGDLWMDPETGDHERVISLFNAADSWLKQLRVRHHDFNYFSTHFM